MSNNSNQKSTQSENKPQANESAPDGDASLSSARTETNRLFAAASKSFESLMENNSHEFLRQSRQTGGQ
jgi:hypothetical protein